MDLDTLITSHIPLVKSIANKLDAPHLKDDLIGEGMVALVKSAKRYDPNRGATFGQFAKVGIRRAMVKLIRRDRNDSVSLDDRDDDGVPYIDTVGSDGQTSVAALRDALRHHLHPVEEWVVVKRYFEKMRMDDVAAELGFKLSRVSQIHSNAIRKLRKAFGSTEEKPQEESGDVKPALLRVVRKMIWDEWGVEVYSEGGG